VAPTARRALLHFLAIGGAAALGVRWLAPEPVQPPIVVDEVRLRALRAAASSENEAAAILAAHIDEEILYREALALGLDRDDVVIRRRLRQKVEYLHSDLADFAPPTEAELAEYLTSHRDPYQVPARVTFQQIYVNPGTETGDQTPYERADVILAGLRSGQTINGDPTLLPQGMRSASEPEIGSTFGDRFAADLMAIKGAGWLGPVASSFGLHLVHINNRVPARTPDLDEIRREVARDFENMRRSQQNEEFLKKLRARYEVEVSMPEGESFTEEPLAPLMEG